MKDIKKKLEENHIATIEGITSIEVGLRYKDLLKTVLPLLRELEIKYEEYSDKAPSGIVLNFLDYLEELVEEK